ncbi:hypothetical protein [Nonomuraea rhizosphaerae]|uniref:hypothetical protein n=1 Tax=Nonomuraea rhizosphaerae TaxID=2665663 RepID=UPI001C5D66BC|nr:hypothetical protein [Nonomuraea rhizosphaerae]
MDTSRNDIAGFRLTENTWITELGNWIDAISPDGRRAGALLFDQRIIALPGVRDRVVATVLTDQRLVLGGLTGLIPVADVVAAGEQVWLLTAQAVSPTLTDVMSSGPIDASGAASVLADTAQTLIALHAAGVTHGSVHPGSVVITAEGAALLSERGLADAIRGQVSRPERDATAWASLARGLGAAVMRGAPRAAQLFERAAVTATTHGLSTARAVVLSEPTALPGGRISQERLAQAARGRSAFAHPPVEPQQPLDEGDIVTLLAVPSPGAGAGSGPVQFGPGVSTEEAQRGTTAERIWREGRGTVQSRGGGKPDRAARARRRKTILAAALFAIVMGGAILAWFKLSGAPELAVKSINVVAPKKTQGCDSAVVVTGTIVTNGEAGEISYEWRKNLDKEVVKQTLRTTADQTSYTVPLRWTLKGRSTVKATATLRVLSPGPTRTDKASFTYKC